MVFEGSFVIRFVLKNGFKMKIPGVGHLARLLDRQESAPYLRTKLKKVDVALKADFI